LTDYRDRITDQAIASDLALFETWTSRLDAAGRQRDSVSRYHRSKARALIELAREEYTDNDRTGIADAALREAIALITQYEGGAVSLRPVPVVDGSTPVRDDLWQLAESLKDASGFRCAASTVARLEVRLVWAGNEALTCGVDDPRPHLEAAEQLARRARERAATCPRMAPIAYRPRLRFATIAPPDTLEIPVLFEAGQTTITLEGVTFELGSARLTAEARTILEGVGRALIENDSIRVEVSGHSDSTGPRAVNMRLSQERADAVRTFLIGEGVEGDRLVAIGFGPDRPRETNATAEGRRQNRRVELRIIEP
jgi:OOP family OmpA-OmpF porin